MKKALAVWLAISLLLMGAWSALAAEMGDGAYTDVPSVTTQDSVHEASVSADGQVEVLPPDQAAVAQLEEVYDFVWSQKNRPARYYDEETQRAIQDLVPEVSIDSLYMTEFMGLQLSGGAGEEDALTLSMQLEPQYVPGQLIVAVLGIVQEDGSYRWYPYRGQVPETGLIRWDIPEDEFSDLTKEKTLLHVLTIRPGAGGGEAQAVPQTEKEIRPSRQSGDLSQVDGWRSTSGAEIDDEFRVFFVDFTEPMQQEMQRMEQFISEGNAPIEWFPEEIQAQAREMKLDGRSLDRTVIYDVAAVMDENYKETYSDVATDNRFATSYSAEKEMFALVGFWTENEEFEWHYLRANGINESTGVEIVYKQLILPTMEEKPAMLIVFSEPLIEDEAKE